MSLLNPYKLICKNKIYKETFWAAVSKSLSVLSGLFILIFIPRVAGIEVYGAFSLIIAYIAIIGIFFGAPIHEGIKKEITESKFTDVSKKYFFEGFKLKIIFSLFGTLLLFSVVKCISIQILEQNFLLFIILCVTMNMWGLVVNGFEAVHRLFYEALIYFIEYSIKIVFIIYFYCFATLNLQNILYSFILGYLFAFLAGFFIFITKFDKVELHNFFKIDIELSKKILHRSFFLALTSISFMILTKIDSIMISFFLSVNDVGFYAISSDLSKNLTIVSVPLIIGVVPLFVKSGTVKLFYKTVKKLVLVNISIFIILFLIAGYAITLLYGAGFENSIPVLRILAIFPLLASIQSFMQSILILKDKTKIIFIFGFIAVAVNILLNLLLIPIFQITGAAIATVISYFIWCSISILYLKKQLAVQRD